MTDVQEVKVEAKVEETQGKLVVVSSRIKDIMHECGCNTSGDLMDSINEQIVIMCKKAAERCKGNGRKIVKVVDL